MTWEMFGINSNAVGAVEQFDKGILIEQIGSTIPTEKLAENFDVEFQQTVKTNELRPTSSLCRAVKGEIFR